jgi:hypothetical protein
VGANPFERAVHEAGHLIAAARLFGLACSPGFAVRFTTIEMEGHSGGCVSWSCIADSDPTRVAAVLLSGCYAHLLCCNVTEEESRLQAQDDLEALGRMKLSDEALSSAVDLAVTLVIQHQLALPKIARELVRQRTFYGTEGLAVVFANAPDMPRSTRKILKRMLQQYRRERYESPPPTFWMDRGPWFQPWEDWMAILRSG